MMPAAYIKIAMADKNSTLQRREKSRESFYEQTQSLFRPLKNIPSIIQPFQNSQNNNKNSKLDDLVAGSSRVILDIHSTFPFDFFPDDVILDETKVTIHSKYFFLTKEVRSVEYIDIFNVIVQQGVFFAKLELVDRFFAHQPIIINYLKKRDAMLARRLIQGMIIAQKHNVDIRGIPVDELLKKLDRIGKSR
ncbi:MAG: hypothetical protein QG600_307 [Patescibacteria group bacterium]|jgi:hypothetical protein|nr:hypothetical protein [Patescibacteria group bacterium]